MGECESECGRVFQPRKSSVYNHLVSRPACCQVYSDSCFSVSCRGRHGYQLQVKVLEAVFQRIHKPNLQKESTIFLKLFNQ